MDKYTAFSKLRESNVVVSDSLLVDAKNIHYSEEVVRGWGKILLKPRRGGYGKGVTLLNSFESLRDIVEYIDSTNKFKNEGGFYIEKFYENNIEDWVSATVIGGKIMYGYRKNIDRFSSLGNGMHKVYSKDEISGGVSLCQLSDKHRKIALKAYSVLELEIVGFDMILNNGEPIIVDVNTFPGMYPELFEQQGIDASKVFYDLIIKKLEL
jgi:ribosomal protein S6--L-glutamate ligase